MRKFDLEAAKAGAPIVTRDGREAKFVTHIPEAGEGFRVVWMQSGIVGCSYENGKLGENIDSRHDLFMKPQKRLGYINIWYNKEHEEIRCNTRPYESMIDAYETAKGSSDYLAIAVQIEIEE